MIYEPDDEKRYIKPVGRFMRRKIWTLQPQKVKKRFGENEKKKWANRDKTSHYQQVKESNRRLLQLCMPWPDENQLK